MSKNLVTEATLRDLGHAARDSIKEPHGYCWYAAKFVRDELRARQGWSDRDASIREVVLADGQKQAKHYVTQVRAAKVEDVDVAGSIVVDPTLDQYCDANKNKEDGVIISLGPRSTIDEVNIFYSVRDEAPYT